MPNSCEYYPRTFSRRDMIRRSACGFGSLALAGLCSDSVSAQDKANTLKERAPMFQPRAKRVIFIFMQGGPSQVDSWDYKPELFKRDGQEIDFTGVRFGTFGSQSKRKLLKPLWSFEKYGECGQYVSELFPHMANHVDKMCMIHSMHTVGVAHGPSTLFLHTGQPISSAHRSAVGLPTGWELRIKTCQALLRSIHPPAKAGPEITPMHFCLPRFKEPPLDERDSRFSIRESETSRSTIPMNHRIQDGINIRICRNMPKRLTNRLLVCWPTWSNVDYWRIHWFGGAANLAALRLPRGKTVVITTRADLRSAAGGGVKAGFVHGASDEIGHHAVENKVHMHDLHCEPLIESINLACVRSVQLCFKRTIEEVEKPKPVESAATKASPAHLSSVVLRVYVSSEPTPFVIAKLLVLMHGLSRRGGSTRIHGLFVLKLSMQFRFSKILVWDWIQVAFFDDPSIIESCQV